MTFIVAFQVVTPGQAYASVDLGTQKVGVPVTLLTLAAGVLILA